MARKAAGLSGIEDISSSLSKLPTPSPVGLDAATAQMADTARKYSQMRGGSAEQQQPIDIVEKLKKDEAERLQTEKDIEEERQQAPADTAPQQPIATQTLQQPTQEKPINHDDEPHGFDISDKISMMGELFAKNAFGAHELGMQKGLLEVGGRAVQLLGKIGETAPEAIAQQLLPATPLSTIEKVVPEVKKISDFYAGGGKEFTDWVNRKVMRNKLYETAQHAHPIIFGLSDIVGNTMGVSPFLEGINGLISGGALSSEAASAIKSAASIAEKSGGAGGFGKMIASTLKDAAAKSIINASKAATAMNIAKWTGQGIAIQESLYDPEDNSMLSNVGIGSILGLVSGVGGRLLQGFASPFKQLIHDVSKEQNISLPIKYGWEKISKWLPSRGYGKLKMDRAKKTVERIEDISTPIADEAKEAMSTDLDNRITESSNKINSGTLTDYPLMQETKNLSNLKNQRELLGKKTGYSKFLYGKAAQSIEEHSKLVSDYNNTILEHLKDSPAVDMTNTRQIATEISGRRQKIVAGLRRNALVELSSNLMGTGTPKEAQQIFNLFGITSPKEMADYMEDYINGDLFKKNPQLYRYLQGAMPNVRKELEMRGLPHKGKDMLDPINSLSDENNMDYEALRMNKTAVGDRQRLATNSQDIRDYKAIYGGMSEDTRNHIKLYGTEETMRLYNEQNRIQHDIVSPLKKMVDIYSDKVDIDADNFIGKVLKPNQPEGIRALLERMPKGDATSKLAVKAAVLHQAYEDAYHTTGINPVKWINSVLHLGETNDVVFSKEEMDVFKGYKKFVDVVERISPDALVEGAAIGAPTSKDVTEKLTKENRLKYSAYAVLGGAGITMAKGALLPLALLSSGFGKLATSQFGRDLMAGMSRVKGNEKEVEMARNVFKYLGFYPAIETTVKSHSNRGQQ